ncbi:MAG: sulfide/dihydroorotate dehydrogenase-like FAD/NAD-binding protein [Candidatus Omnitrophota bacterium]
MKILRKATLCNTEGIKITTMEISAPDIAAKVRAGQFVVLMTGEKGERIPLTVVDSNNSSGSITLIFQEVGLTTKLLGKLEVGGELHALAGPLGHATEVKKYGKVILVGGGVGIAEIYPVAKALKGAGNEITVILGARTKNLLILEAELKGSSDRLLVATDDGSYERRGFTTDILAELLAKDKYDLVYAVGPIPMMKRVADVTKNSGTSTVVSLNALMVDATGMCGCCRVTVGGEVKFSCVDGPEFEASLVDWDGLIKRNRVYADKEKHLCKLV